MLTRRRFLANTAIGVPVTLGTLSATSDLSAEPSLATLSNSIHEITMAAPDIVCLELRDAPFTPGQIHPLRPAATGRRRGEWIVRDGVWGRVIGPDQDHYRTSDTKPWRWIDRSAVDDPTRYTRIGGLRVTSVFRKSVPYDSGIYRSAAGATVQGAALKHYVYLRLEARLLPGKHRVAGPVEETWFTFSDVSRAISIRANQHGHRPGDHQKIGYLSLWLPGGPEEGAFSFAPYGLESFNVIDAANKLVYSNAIELRLGPAELETSEPALHEYRMQDGRTHAANRSGTYVYGLDYSAWSGGEEGVYRLQIPGLGVSDPFVVAEGAWYAAARVSLIGLYHHRSGIRLDGRFGYSRPVNQRPGQTGPVFRSKLPYLFSSENSLGFIPFGQGAAKPWITEQSEPEAWGGYMDAGDWDRRADHLQIANGLLLVHEVLPAGAREISWGIPKSAELLDPSLYGAMVGAPDLLHEVAFSLDVYRRMQVPENGAVRGGIESSHTPEYGEPSYLESHTTFAYAPDHQSAWRYAASAARFARVMEDLNCKPVAGTYRTTARAAFDWAEGVHADLDGGYEEAILLARSQGAFRGKPWANIKAAIIAETRRSRASSAAALYRLEGDIRFRDIFEALFREGLDDFEEGGDARWDYARASHGNANLDQRAMLDQFVGTARRHIVQGQFRGTNYSSMKWSGTAMRWGHGNAPDYNQIQMLIRAHAHSQDAGLIKCMQAGMAHVLGANQVGMCMTTGLGHRTVRHPLHEDHRAMGVEVPSGITVYGYGPWQETDYDWVWGPHYWAPLPGSSGVAGDPDHEDAAKRAVHPFRKSMPLFEYFIEHPLQIMQQEYTVHQSINTCAMAALYLHGYDGNRVTSMPPGASVP